MIQLFDLLLSDFFHFIGGIIILYILLYFPSNLILQIIHKIIRAKTISKHGYPPQHCDGLKFIPHLLFQYRQFLYDESSE